jgi:hypothetical protein
MQGSCHSDRATYLGRAGSSKPASNLDNTMSQSKVPLRTAFATLK